MGAQEGRARAPGGREGGGDSARRARRGVDRGRRGQEGRAVGEVDAVVNTEQVVAAELPRRHEFEAKSSAACDPFGSVGELVEASTIIISSLIGRQRCWPQSGTPAPPPLVSADGPPQTSTSCSPPTRSAAPGDPRVPKHTPLVPQRARQTSTGSRPRPSAPSSTSRPRTMLSGADVAAHSSRESLWMVIHGKVRPVHPHSPHARLQSES